MACLLSPDLLAGLTLLLVAGSADFEGEGISGIVGGNVVSARARALRQARRQALSAAVSSALTGAEDDALAERSRRWAQARESVYILTYRVLEQEQVEDVFRLRITASVDVGRLRRDLNGLGMQASPRSRSPRAATAALALWAAPLTAESVASESIRSVLRRDMLARVRGRLAEAGVVVSLLEAPRRREEALTQAGQLGHSALLTLEVAAAAEPEVRGLALAGASSRVTLTLMQLGDEAAAEAQKIWRGEAVAAGDGLQRALAQALQEALATPLRQVVTAAAAILPPASNSRGEQLILLHLEGLTSLAQQRALCRRMRMREPRLRECTLRRLSGNSIVVGLAASRAPAAVGRTLRLAAEDLGLTARVTQLRQRSLRVRLSALPLPNTELE